MEKYIPHIDESNEIKTGCAHYQSKYLQKDRYAEVSGEPQLWNKQVAKQKEIGKETLKQTDVSGCTDARGGGAHVTTRYFFVL